MFFFNFGTPGTLLSDSNSNSKVFKILKINYDCFKAIYIGNRRTQTAAKAPPHPHSTTHPHAHTAHHPPTTPHLDYHQSLTPSYTLQLCSFSWLTAAKCQR